MIWASTYCYGYEVLDFGRHDLQHIEESQGEDFIWTVVCLSPDQQLLAIEGCYWACPYEIRLLDVRESSSGFPFPEVGLFQHKQGTLQWTSNGTLQTTDNGKQSWRGVISPAWHESDRNLSVWQALARGSEIVIGFLSPREFKEQAPRKLLEAEDSVLVEVLASSADEASFLIRE